jgi:uncharacterized protein YcnI
MKRRLVTVLGVGLASLIPAVASAHVIVTPSQAGVAQELVFTASVPNEKQVAVTGLRIVIPAGVKEVTPTVKAGWTITTKGSGDNINEIDWTAGSIPVGQRDDFSFGAQAPARATTLNWKAYQTYADGSVVSWDQTPAGSDDATGDKGPYSTTTVVNDLPTATSPAKTAEDRADVALAVAIVALVGVLGMVGGRRKIGRS